jgi:regulatory protein
MPKITNFTPQQKNQDRVNVFIDEKYAFSLDIFQVSELKIKVGQELSETELENLKKASEFGKLYARTLNWLVSRPHSEREARDYLFKKSTPPELSTAVINRLKYKNYLNDANFARFWIENRFQTKGISKKRLELELMKKGIKKEIIVEALEGSSRSDVEEIDKIIAKKRKKYTDAPDKLLAYLIRQGFDYELARSRVFETDSQNLA